MSVFDPGRYQCPDEWRSRPMPTLYELALFLRGSETSFTGQLLRLMMKADPGHRARLARGFPVEAEALEAWMALEPVTFGSLLDTLTEMHNETPLSERLARRFPQ